MNLVTIMNFVRGCEPRDPNMNLIEPVKEQIKLNKKYNFKNTFLIQYDALINPEFTDLFKENSDDNTEFGVWIEIVRPLVEKVGIKWRGREGYDWDWYVNPGFLPAYTQDEKERLIDELMKKFKEVFGYLPKTAASWLLDSYSTEYMQKKYDIKTFGICREQLSVDAYTLWGGPYNQPYYPSKSNILCPAQSKENRIDAPVFRLLGIDPIRGYNENVYANEDGLSGCATMEPVWSFGKSPKYMEWFFKTYFENENMGIAYTQIGQENSFGWDSMKDGLQMQYELVKKYADEKKISVVKMHEAGEMFKNAFSDTPPAAIVANSDPAESGRYRSIWFTNKNYRANLFFDKDVMYFRDIQKFDEKYAERYITKPCDTWDAVYDALPVCDERCWSDKDTQEAAIRFDGSYVICDIKRTADTLTVFVKKANGETAMIVFAEKSVKVLGAESVKWNFANFNNVSLDGELLNFEHNGFEYSVKVKGEVKTNNDNMITLGAGEFSIEF